MRAKRWGAFKRQYFFLFLFLFSFSFFPNPFVPFILFLFFLSNVYNYIIQFSLRLRVLRFGKFNRAPKSHERLPKTLLDNEHGPTRGRGNLESHWLIGTETIRVTN